MSWGLALRARPRLSHQRRSAHEPTGRTTPYEAACGGGSNGSCATLECDAGVNTGVIGVGIAATTETLALGVAAVHDWQLQSKSCAAGAAAALTVDDADRAATCPTGATAGFVAVEPISELEPHVMLFPDTPNMIGSYAEQPRHHTVMHAVKSAVSRARGDRERCILLGR